MACLYERESHALRTALSRMSANVRSSQPSESQSSESSELETLSGAQRRPRRRRRNDDGEITFEEDVMMPCRKKKKIYHASDRRSNLRPSSSSSSSSSSSTKTPVGRRKEGSNRVVAVTNSGSTYRARSACNIPSPPCQGSDATIGAGGAIALISASPGNASSPSSSSTPGGGATANNDDWKARSISEDYEVFLKTGINPRQRDSCKSGKCFGCNMRGDGTPLKKKNVEVFIRRMDDLASSVSDAYSRSQLVERDYERLIRDPKKRLRDAFRKMEGDGDKRKYKNNEHPDRRHHRQHHDGSDCGGNDGGVGGDDDGENEDDEDDGDDDDDGEDDDRWDKVDIYNHLVRHAGNVVEDIDYLRRSTLKQLKLLEDCLFVEHPVKRNSLGEPLLIMNESAARCYKDLVKCHLDICKSRPDLMTPFYDGRRTATPRTVASLTNNNHSSGTTTISQTDLGGRLLYGKGL